MTERGNNHSNALDIKIRIALELIDSLLFYEKNREKMASLAGCFLAIEDNNKITAIGKSRSIVAQAVPGNALIIKVPLDPIITTELITSVFGKQIPFPKDITSANEN